MESLLCLPLLEAAQLRELIQHLPDPQAAAEEMMRRGWITQNQFSSLFPAPQPRPTPRETMLVGFGDDQSPADSDCEDWDLSVSGEEDKAGVQPRIEWAQPVRNDEERPPEPETVETAPALASAASSPQSERNLQVPPVPSGNESRWRECDTDKLPRPGMSWTSKGLVLWALILGSLFVGVQFFGVNSTVLPVARLESTSNARQPDDHRDGTGQNPPVAFRARDTAAAPARANDANPRSTASLYARVRQVVLEHKTEETQRLGIGNLAYQDVPDDGSIMVGMEVTYAPFFTQQVIKSVRPIYQGPDGTRYDGPVCGNPTQVIERVVAKEGYAVGGAAIKAGMGIDGIQLTFMEIGPDGLKPDKSYLSKWLGGNGGAAARSFVNDGRPIVGVAGMKPTLPDHGPAFSMCLITTKAGAIAAANGLRSNPKEQQFVRLPIATRSIESNTKLVRPEDYFQVQEFPDDGPGAQEAVTTLDNLRGKEVKWPVLKGMPITRAQIGDKTVVATQAPTFSYRPVIYGNQPIYGPLWVQIDGRWVAQVDEKTTSGRPR